MNKKGEGFTLIELLVVITIISLLVIFTLIIFTSVRAKARDAKRKSELVQIARFMTKQCYIPTGPGVSDGMGNLVYDFKELFEELKAANPEVDKAIVNIPRDPKAGNDTTYYYKYIVNTASSNCAIYANLENDKEEVSLSIIVPTPAGGDGIFEAATVGWNGTKLYLQYSN